MLTQGANSKVWDTWHTNDGPRYPHAKVIQFCLRHFKPDERSRATALDLGCGNGVNSLFLAREGFTVKGVDFSEQGIVKARDLFKVEGLRGDFQVGGIDESIFSKKNFELIISVGVLDCAGFEVSKTAISNMSKILSPGGRGLFIFASDLDFRLKLTNELSLHGYTDKEVEELFGNKFKTVHYDRYITTYENGSRQQNDWIISVQN